jgi:sigma-E factor negative regulatory protein RseC
MKIAYALKAPNEVFSLPDSLGVRPGERIVIGLDDGAPLRGALASYGLGTVLLVLGAMLGGALAPLGANVDLFALMGSGMGLTLAVVLNRVLFRSRRWRSTFQMQMVRDSGRCEIQER